MPNEIIDALIMNDGQRGQSMNKLWIYLSFSFALGCFCSYIALNNRPAGLMAKAGSGAVATSGFEICRTKDLNKIKPLSVERIDESPVFDPLKFDLARLVDSLKNGGALTQASVYIREFDHREWMALNKDEQYHPASLMKVPLLICCLQTLQLNPSLFDQKLVYDKPDSVQINPQFYAYPTIQPGKSYSVHELLYYMIAYSDNNATWLLARHFDTSRMKKLFADFCLPEPVPDDLKFTMSAKDYSTFIKAIYSCSLLSPEYSEYAADLMSNCSFREGFAKGFPEGTRMWHKFGEWRSMGFDYELHESGIVNIKDKPYLITIMTKGRDTEKQAEIIRLISRRIYDKIPTP